MLAVETIRSIGTQIKQLRKKRGLSQTDLAKLLNTTQSGVSRLEKQDNTAIKFSTLQKIADALDGNLLILLSKRQNK